MTSVSNHLELFAKQIVQAKKNYRWPVDPMINTEQILYKQMNLKWSSAQWRPQYFEQAVEEVMHSSSDECMIQ